MTAQTAANETSAAQTTWVQSTRLGSGPDKGTEASTPAEQPTSNAVVEEDTSFLAIVRILLLLQGAIGLASFIEVTIAGAAQGIPLLPIMALTGGSATLTLWLAARVGRRGRKTRRTIVILQYLWLFGATVDLLLSVAMTQRILELVPTLTRIVVPIALIRMLGKPQARLLFGVPPSRRQRRKARRATRRLAEVTP